MQELTGSLSLECLAGIGVLAKEGYAGRQSYGLGGVHLLLERKRPMATIDLWYLGLLLPLGHVGREIQSMKDLVPLL